MKKLLSALLAVLILVGCGTKKPEIEMKTAFENITTYLDQFYNTGNYSSEKDTEADVLHTYVVTTKDVSEIYDIIMTAKKDTGNIDGVSIYGNNKNVFQSICRRTVAEIFGEDRAENIMDDLHITRVGYETTDVETKIEVDGCKLSAYEEDGRANLMITIGN